MSSYLTKSSIEIATDGNRYDDDPKRFHLWVGRKKGLTKQEAIILKNQLLSNQCHTHNCFNPTKKGFVFCEKCIK